jgi:para-aminobenzoate synthetase component 1
MRLAVAKGGGRSHNGEMVRSGWEFPRLSGEALPRSGLCTLDMVHPTTPFALFFDGASGRAMVLTEPLGSVTGWEDRLEVEAGGRRLGWSGNPLDHIEEAYQACGELAALSPSPHRCFAGAFHYDLRRCVESFTRPSADDSGLPWISWTLFGAMATWEERPEQSCGDPRRFQTGESAPSNTRPDCRTSLDREAFSRAVRRILRHEHDGDVYQVNLTRQIEMPIACAPYSLWQGLVRPARAPLSAYLDFGNFQILSLSPERLLRREGERLWTQPIKGTSPRGETAAEDAENLARLLEGEKEAAELAMIVDVQRNDLGRIARPGEVRLSEHRRVITLPNVHHLSSCVEAKLRPGVGLADMLRATFPGGSVTGAPKIRAMQIIDELEPVARGYYCGALGWMDLSGDFDWSLPIRTAVVQGRALKLGTGGGIVVDSDPNAEWEETVAKARCFIRDEEMGR